LSRPYYNKNILSASTHAQATPPLRTDHKNFGVAIFLHWVPSFFDSLQLVVSLCWFGFGGWVWLIGWTLAIPLAVGWWGVFTS
jgi:hypothetical protein